MKPTKKIDDRALLCLSEDAETLIQLDIELTEITTVRSLKEALETCLRRSTDGRKHAAERPQ